MVRKRIEWYKHKYTKDWKKSRSSRRKSLSSMRSNDDILGKRPGSTKRYARKHGFWNKKTGGAW